MAEYRKGQPVRHRTRKLYEATFERWSDSGKTIGVKHNSAAPWGVWVVVDYFKPDSIEAIPTEQR